MIKSICVYCGSNKGNNSLYVKAANDLGNSLVKNKLDLIYGGANVGLMKEVANTVLQGNQNVTGVITHFLEEKHLTLPGLTKLITVETMQERKKQMADLADAFIVLPGGIGTLEELFEVLTAAQLGFHNKPIGILNINNYYDLLLDFLDKIVAEKFLLPIHKSIVLKSQSPDELIQLMKEFEMPKAGKWIEDIITKN